MMTSKTLQKAFKEYKKANPRTSINFKRFKVIMSKAQELGDKRMQKIIPTTANPFAVVDDNIKRLEIFCSYCNHISVFEFIPTVKIVHLIGNSYCKVCESDLRNIIEEEIDYASKISK